MKRSHWVAGMTVLVALLAAPPGFADAPAPPHKDKAPAVPSKELTLKALDGKTVTITAYEFAALPHKSVTVFNSHSMANVVYSGVVLVDLLAKVDAPLADKLRGATLTTGVIAEGTDGYRALYSLAELDPSMHSGDVIVADTLDGKKLTVDGAFKVVATQDKRPARWVRNLASLTVISVKP